MIFKDTFEDLTPERLGEIIEQFEAGKGGSVPVGPQNGRTVSAPLSGLTTLTDEAAVLKSTRENEARKRPDVPPVRNRLNLQQLEPRLRRPPPAPALESRKGRRSPVEGRKAEDRCGRNQRRLKTPSPVKSSAAGEKAESSKAPAFDPVAANIAAEPVEKVVKQRKGPISPSGSAPELASPELLRGEPIGPAGKKVEAAPKPALTDPNRPAAIEKPAQPDDLKLISGVGPEDRRHPAFARHLFVRPGGFVEEGRARLGRRLPEFQGSHRPRRLGPAGRGVGQGRRRRIHPRLWKGAPLMQLTVERSHRRRLHHRRQLLLVALRTAIDLPLAMGWNQRWRPASACSFGSSSRRASESMNDALRQGPHLQQHLRPFDRSLAGAMRARPLGRHGRADRQGPRLDRQRDEGVWPARPRRRRLSDRVEMVLHAQAERRPAELSRRQCGRVRARHLQGPRHPASRPPHAGGRLPARRLRDGRDRCLHLCPRRVHPRARGAAARHRRGLRSRADRQGQFERLRFRDLRSPRRRRLYLRRGDGAARKPRGQEGAAAAEAAVPGECRPLWLPDDRQQRRVDRGRADASCAVARPGSRPSAGRTMSARSSSASPATSTIPARSRRRCRSRSAS